MNSSFQVDHMNQENLGIPIKHVYDSMSRQKGKSLHPESMHMPACHERKEILGTLLKRMYASKFQKKRKPFSFFKNSS